ncbi:hypothetical protein CEXT_276841 [Caerostris extrusa]|uniref:Uncharacterized protein n=1 Tax=Caerostris extrusa TaxID=172846 RepID=A0AAV4NLH3_CAEEX|nr:hypothetical protein CEXT_276841 [Caerostris extrusa]
MEDLMAYIYFEANAVQECTSLTQWYLNLEPMTYWIPPSPVSVVSQKWNSLEVSWPREAKGWLATFYNVRVCQQERTTECSDHTKLEGRWNFVAEQLSGVHSIRRDGGRSLGTHQCEDQCQNISLYISPVSRAFHHFSNRKDDPRDSHAGCHGDEGR